MLLQSAAVTQPRPASRIEDRLRDYIERFEREASALVAEEHYEQRLTRWHGKGPATMTTRSLRSDYVLVKPSDSEPWLGYRDIFEVDGKPVRDREQRLVAVLSSTAADTRERAFALVQEGARFNLGPERTVNVPTLPLQLLARGNRPRFRVRVPRGWQRQETVELPFEESVKPTIVRTPEGFSVETRGTMTVRVRDGAMLRAHLRFYFSGTRRNDPEGSLIVNYGDVPGITVPVPLQMREELPMPSARATGLATYSKYRRFQTSVRIR